jgi:hypothetical protein
MKSDTFNFNYILKNHNVKKYLKEKSIIDVDSKKSETKIKILESSLDNIISCYGKG